MRPSHTIVSVGKELTPRCVIPASVVWLSRSRARIGHCSTRQSNPARPIASALVVACSITVPKRCQAGSPVTNIAARPVVWSISCAARHLPKRKKTSKPGRRRPQSPRNLFDLPASSRSLPGGQKQRVLAAGDGNASAADERHATRSPAGQNPALHPLQHHRRICPRSEDGKAGLGRWRFDSGVELDVPRRPAASGRVRPLQQLSGPTCRLVFPAPSLLFPTVNHIGLRARKGGAEERSGPGGPLLCVRIDFQLRLSCAVFSR
jgi:hypothetical protein